MRRETWVTMGSMASRVSSPMPPPGHAPQLNIPRPKEAVQALLQGPTPHPRRPQQHLGQPHRAAASIRSSLLSSAVGTFGNESFRLSTTRPSSKGPVLPPSLLHLDLEHGKGCTQGGGARPGTSRLCVEPAPPASWVQQDLGVRLAPKASHSADR